MGQTFFVYFRSFQTNIVTPTFATNKCEKCPSSIRCRDSNSQPSDYESPPLTTRPPLFSNLLEKYQLFQTFVKRKNVFMRGHARAVENPIRIQQTIKRTCFPTVTIERMYYGILSAGMRVHEQWRPHRSHKGLGKNPGINQKLPSHVTWERLPFSNETIKPFLTIELILAN